MFKQLIEGDDVVSIYEMTLGTPGGETLVISFADWIQVVNGKIARQRLYYDPRQFVKAFGV
jgi:ketosteroid isomerase-like protein